MPSVSYQTVTIEDYLARLTEPDLKMRNIIFLESLGIGIFYGDDSDTRAAIIINGKEVAYVRNTRDGQDFVAIVERSGEERVRELLARYESDNGYGETSVVCYYEEKEH